MPLDPRLRTAWERFLALVPLFLVLAHGALWVLSATTLGTLEGRIAFHFDASGTPDGWIDAASWWVLPLIGSGILALFLGVLALVRWLVRRHPGAVNVPRKAEFVALPEAARLRVMPRITQLVLGLVLILHFALLAIVRDTHRIATHQIERLALWKLLVPIGLALVWVAIGVVRIRNVIRKEASAAGTPTA